MPFDQEVRKTIFISGLGYFNVATSVLVINCGSSSIKYALVSERREDRIYGLAENLGQLMLVLKGLPSVENR
ncbi:Acetate kinase [Acinetobacter baumannii]|nr:Acetate kinase [Acinetobacter baumannii]